MAPGRCEPSLATGNFPAMIRAPHRALVKASANGASALCGVVLTFTFLGTIAAGSTISFSG
jgi:hypothetical protein